MFNRQRWTDQNTSREMDNETRTENGEKEEDGTCRHVHADGRKGRQRAMFTNTDNGLLLLL